MADAPTPDNTDSPKFSHEKDRTCPFCNTKFTSSSLGRHLDLYIKERNPKAPDGIHIVEEIRKLRGNVTRRQAKLSSSKRDGSTPTSSNPNSLRGQRSPSASASSLPKPQRNGGSVNLKLNQPNWTNTGVINDIPLASEDVIDEQGKRRSSTRNVSVKEGLHRKHLLLDEKDRARATELALRDVLRNIKAAKYSQYHQRLFSVQSSLTYCVKSMRAHPQSPFDFNLFGLSFPAMCLSCLSAPPAISFGSRISKERPWSIEPPSSYHLEALRRWLDSKMRDWRIRRRALGRPADHHEVNGHDSLDSPWSHSDPEADEHEAACTKHINASYSSWDILSKERKKEQWHEECVNALTHEQECHRDTRDRLERLENQVQSLRAELNARENHDYAPTNLPLSPNTALETLKVGPELAMWDYDALITKWRTRIEHERSRQLPLPCLPMPWSAPTPDNAKISLFTNGANHSTKPEQRASFGQRTSHGTNGADEDEDLVDAPGEDDDSALLDPNLRGKLNGHQELVMGTGSPQGKG